MKFTTPGSVCAWNCGAGFCNGTILHKWRLGFLCNCLYPGGYGSSHNSIYMSSIHNCLTRGGRLPETSCLRCNKRPPCRSCWDPHVSWLWIFLAQKLRWSLQNFYSMLQWVHIALAVNKNVSHNHNWILVPIWRVVDSRYAHLGLRVHSKAVICWQICCVIWIASQFPL